MYKRMTSLFHKYAAYTRKKYKHALAQVVIFMDTCARLDYYM